MSSPNRRRLLDEFEENLRVLAEAQHDVLEAYRKRTRAPRSGRNGPAALRAESPRSRSRPAVARRVTRQISVETVPALLDHCFFPQRDGWKSVADRFPVVPMALTLEWAIEAAREAAPDGAPVRVEDLRARRWIVAEPPLEVAVEVRRDERSRVGVAIEDYAEATVFPAPAYPAPPSSDLPALAGARPCPIPAETVYASGALFHGPAYQGLVELGSMGDNGIDGIIRVPEGPGAALDNAGQLLGIWVMASRPEDAIVMPLGIESISYFSTPPSPGSRISCRVRVRSERDREIVADMDLFTRSEAWARIRGWTMRRFDCDARLGAVLQQPSMTTLSDIPGPFAAYDGSARRAPSHEWLVRRYLCEEERAMLLAAGPRGRRTFLHGRIAAKDAVRDFLWSQGHGALFPAEVRVVQDERGRPCVRGLPGRDLRVSISHCGQVSVALVADGRDPGIDIEEVRGRPDGFSGVAFADSERTIAERSDEWATRLWCAKEAVAKARGTGLQGNPRSFVATQVDGDRIAVNGTWVATRVVGRHVVAWTER